MATGENISSELIIEFNKAIQQLNSFVSIMDQKLTSASKTSGQKSGQNFGKSFVAIASGIVGSLSFLSLNSLVQNITQNVDSYIALQKANLAFSGAVDATNKRLSRQNAILADTKSTIEQKAAAIGIDTDILYKNVSANISAGSAVRNHKNEIGALKKSISEQTKSFTENQRALESTLKVQEQSLSVSESQVKAKDIEINKIDKEVISYDRLIAAIKKQTAEKVNAIRTSLGADVLEQERETLAIQKNQLEIKRDTAKINKDLVSAKFIQLEIDLLNDQINLNKNKLDAIDLQTQSVERLEKARIKELQTQKESVLLQKEVLVDQRATLQEQTEKIKDAINLTKQLIANNKAQFDIDIEPLKNKIAEIRSIVPTTIIGGGGSGTKRILDPEIVKQINELSQKQIPINLSAQINDKKLQQLTERVVKKYGKIVKEADVKKSVSDLIFAGLTDIDKIETLIGRFADSAALGKSAGVSFSQALSNLSFAFKTGSSSLGNLSGIPENFSEIDKAGRIALANQARDLGDLATANRVQNGLLTVQEKTQARYLGVLQVTEDTLGGYEKAITSGLTAQEEFTLELEKTQEILGGALLPSFNQFLAAIRPITASFADFAAKNPEIILSLTGVGLALGFVLVSLSTLTGLMSLFGVTSLAVLSPLLLPFAKIIVVIGAIIGLVAGLYSAWQNNFFGVRDITESVFKKILTFYDQYIRPLIDRISIGFADTFNKITKFFADGSITWQEKLGVILGFFASLPVKVAFFISGVISKITNILTTTDWGTIWSGLLEGIQSTFNSISKFLSSIDWKRLLRGAANGIADFFRGVIIGLGAGIPGAESVFKVLALSIPKFATGGLVSGRNVLAMLNDGGGPEFVMNAEATKKNLSFLNSLNHNPNMLRNSSISDNRSYDNSRHIQINNYTTSSSFTLPFNQVYKNI